MKTATVYSKRSFLTKISLLIILCMCFFNTLKAQFTHPGISHKLSDLDRMKYMVEAGIEPWATTFEKLSNHGRAQYTDPNAVSTRDPSYFLEYSSASDAYFINDGTTAYYNALMWYITGDSRHADTAVRIFNNYKGLKRNTTNIPLESGRIWRIIEAAEIIAHTYDGWAASDIQDFKDMLVYPGYSSTTVPTAAIASDDYTFYWHVYNGDPARHGNQGLFAFRTMMAIAIFTDNEIMYDRVIRYLKGQPHRPDDLEYPSGPSINKTTNTSQCDYFEQYTRTGQSTDITDYGYNEVISNYIFENGQSQESSRDQAHALAGVSTICNIAEMAWNQGDDLYGHLDNRPLLGLEFFYRYNLSYKNSYPDQTSPWEPTVASGEYIERTDRSGRWKALKINPGVNCNTTKITRGASSILQPIYEMNLGHYKDRMNLPADDYKWLQRGFELLTAQIGVEGEGTVTDHPGYGGLKFRRVSPGDPISGFDSNGLPSYEMNVIPATIEAENYDYFANNGQGHTYNDTTNGNLAGAYRTDESVDIKTNPDVGYYISSIRAGEWLTYTIYVPATDTYNITANIASPNGTGKIRFEFDGVDKTGNISVPNTGNWETFQNMTVANNVTLTKGVQQMKVHFPEESLNLNSISINTYTTPVAGKTYYIDNVGWNVRLGADGQELPYTTSTNTTGANVEWKVTASSVSGYYYLDCIGGGEIPRIRTDRKQLADMQSTSSNGNQTRWEFTDVGNDKFLLTTQYTNLDFERLRINNSLQVETVSDVKTGAWAQFTFTEVTKTNPTVPIGSTIWLQSVSNNQYVCADLIVDSNFGYLHANRFVYAGWESFTVEDAGNGLIRLYSHATGEYIRINPNTNKVDATGGTGDWTPLSWVTNNDGTISIKAIINGNYLSNTSNTQILANVSSISDTEKFTYGIIPKAKNSNSKSSIAEKAITLYPNPAHNFIVVDYNNGENNAIEIFNTSGKRVFQTSIKNNEPYNLDISNFSAGIYFMKITNNEATHIKKFIKN